MINVYQGVKKYGLDTPFIEAAAELALHTESGTFMKRGNYAVVEVGPKYVYPPIKLAFTTDLKVMVAAGEDFVTFQHEGTEYVFWRTESLRNNPDEPLVA